MQLINVLPKSKTGQSIGGGSQIIRNGVTMMLSAVEPRLPCSKISKGSFSEG